MHLFIPFLLENPKAKSFAIFLQYFELLIMGEVSNSWFCFSGPWEQPVIYALAIRHSKYI